MLTNVSLLSLAAMTVFGAAASLAAESTSAVLEADRTVFANTCARCHNADGSGNIAVGIPNFADPRWQDTHSDAELKAAITNGLNGRMPAFASVLTPEQIEVMVKRVVRPLRDSSVQPDQRLTEEELHPVRIEPRLLAPGFGREGVLREKSAVLTQHNDNARTGANLSESILNPTNVHTGSFGLLFRQDVDDQVFAQPLYVPDVPIAGGRHNLVFVATVANTLYAFDADRRGAPYWQLNLGQPGSVQLHHCWCLDILGNMGIIGTPVIDPAAGTLYVVALNYDHGAFVHKLHALELSSGKERRHSPVTIAAPEFVPAMENQRPALLLSQGSVYIGFSSHCDMNPYHGFLFRFDASTLQQQGVINLSPGGDGNSIWQSGQGPVADSSGDIFFVTSNGKWDGQRNFADSVIRLNRDLGFLDWFTPSNYEQLDKADWDLNSAGALLVPGSNEVAAVGKEGVIYLIDKSHFGHLGDENALQRLRVAKGEVNVGPVYWKSKVRGEMLYIWGQDDALKVYALKNRLIEPTPMGVGSTTSAYPGGILSLSANGETDGILWANAALTAHGGGHINGPAVLRAYDANDVSRELWNSNLDPDHDTCGRISKTRLRQLPTGKSISPALARCRSAQVRYMFMAYCRPKRKGRAETSFERNETNALEKDLGGLGN